MTAVKPRLGFYCPGNGTGGPWRYLHAVLGALDPAEFEASVFCDLPGRYEPNPAVRVIRLGQATPYDGGASAAAEPPPRPRPHPLARLTPPPVKLWAGFAGCTIRLARALAANPVHLLHTQNTGCEESPVAARLAGVRHVIGTFHVDSTYDLHRTRSGLGHRILEAVSNRCLDDGIAVSTATGRDWARRTPGIGTRIRTIYNGIDPARFRRRRAPAEARRRLGLPEAGLIVGGVGRLDDAKGFTDLIAAAADLRGRFPDLTTVIAGSGPLRDRLEAEVAARGLTGRVRFLGFQPDVQGVLDALDVFALPSWCEACPYAVLEAMAAALPVVGSAVGGVPELVAAGETGLVVPARNPAALGSALGTLLADGDLRRRWGEAGRERVAARFHEREMVRKTIDLYRAVVSADRRGGR